MRPMSVETATDPLARGEEALHAGDWDTARSVFEGSLAEAFQFIRSGQCSAAGASAFRAQALRRPPDERQPHRESGWQVLLGSY